MGAVAGQSSFLFFLSCYDRTIDPVVLRTGILLAFRQGLGSCPCETIQCWVAFDRTIHYSTSALRVYTPSCLTSEFAIRIMGPRYSWRRSLGILHSSRGRIAEYIFETEMCIFSDSFITTPRILKLALLNYYVLNISNWFLVARTRLIDKKQNMKCEIIKHLWKIILIFASLLLFYNFNFYSKNSLCVRSLFLMHRNVEIVVEAFLRHFFAYPSFSAKNTRRHMHEASPFPIGFTFATWL